MVACLHIMKEVSKLFVLVVCCLVPSFSAAPLDCVELSRYCQPYGSAWWEIRADYCFNCGDKVYHCARDYDNPDAHREGCAVEKNCSAGEEPHLSFIKNGHPLTEPIVYCNPCYDRNYFNRISRLSSTYSECPNRKMNDCSRDKHKIFCENEDLTDERYCRCDARNGFSPINDFSYEMCSYKDYECLDDFKCKLPNGEPQQMLLNYTCAAFCDEGYDRTSQISDECFLQITVAPSKKPTTGGTTLSAGTATTPTSTSPSTTTIKTSTVLKLGCDEECVDYSICVNRTCVCPEPCLTTRKPVCGYDEDSNKPMTFNSECDLRRKYCQNKQFSFQYEGECKQDVPAKWIVVCVIVGFIVLLCLGFIFYKSPLGKKCKKKWCPYNDNLNFEIHVHTPRIDSPEEETSFTDSQPNGISADSQENLRSQMERNQIYISNTYNQCTVIQPEGKNIQISSDSHSEQNKRKKKYEDEKKLDGEDKPFLEHASTDIPANHLEVPMTTDFGASDTVKDEKVNALNGDENATESNTESDQRKDEEDTDGKPITKQLPVKNMRASKRPRSLKRTPSVSHDSLLVPEIHDVESLFASKEIYRNMIIAVYRTCWNYLLKHMNPEIILDFFNEKQMFDFIVIRDIYQIKAQTKQNRHIISKLIETGTQNYKLFKEILMKSKQYNCVTEVERVQKEVLVKMNICEAVTECTTPVRIRRYSSRHDSMPDIPCIPDKNDETLELTDMKTDDKSDACDQNHVGYKPKEKAPSCEEITNHDSSEKEKASGNLYEMQEHKEENRSSKCVVEVFTEEGSHRVLQRFTKTVSNLKEKSMAEVDRIFKELKEKVEELSDLSADSLLPDHLVDNLRFPENHQNTPPQYQAYRSSGKENSCLYQSISLHLTGSEDMQYRLRLLATLHAVKSLEYYKKQLLFCPLEKLKWFFHSNFGEQMDLSELDNAETLVDICLKSLIMETACLGTDSSVLHVRFLCGALGVKIIQHFQQYSDYGKSLETIPWEQILLEKPLNGNLPDLHIFWVNHGHNEKGSMNHIVPLLPVKTTQEDSESSV